MKELKLEKRNLELKANKCDKLEEKIRQFKFQISELKNKINLQNEAISKAKDLKVHFDEVLEDFHSTKIDLDEMTLLRDKISNDFNIA
jgi:TolA-binding protein